MAAAAVGGALIKGPLNQLSDEFRALPVVFWIVGFLLHLGHTLPASIRWRLRVIDGL
jgi:hypothetical protein